VERREVLVVRFRARIQAGLRVVSLP
jgi:hypothetical protein